MAKTNWSDTKETARARNWIAQNRNERRVKRSDGNSQQQVFKQLETPNSVFQKTSIGDVAAQTSKVAKQVSSELENILKNNIQKIINKLGIDISISGFIQIWRKGIEAKILFFDNQIEKTTKEKEKIESYIDMYENLLETLKKQESFFDKQLEATINEQIELYWQEGPNKDHIDVANQATEDFMEDHGESLDILKRQMSANQTTTKSLKRIDVLKASKIGIAIEVLNQTRKAFKNSTQVRLSHIITSVWNFLKIGPESAFLNSVAKGIGLAKKAVVKPQDVKIIKGLETTLNTISKEAKKSGSGSNNNNNQNSPFAKFQSSWMDTGTYNNKTFQMYVKTKPSRRGIVYAFIVYGVTAQMWVMISTAIGSGSMLWNTAWAYKRTVSVGAPRWSGLSRGASGKFYSRDNKGAYNKRIKRSEHA